jgi:hypothetical protein
MTAGEWASGSGAKAEHRSLLFWLLLYAHRHRSILGAAGHIILTPAMGLKYAYGANIHQ